MSDGDVRAALGFAVSGERASCCSEAYRASGSAIESTSPQLSSHEGVVGENACLSDIVATRCAVSWSGMCSTMDKMTDGRTVCRGVTIRSCASSADRSERKPVEVSVWVRAIRSGAPSGYLHPTTSQKVPTQDVRQDHTSGI